LAVELQSPADAQMHLIQNWSYI